MEESRIRVYYWILSRAVQTQYFLTIEILDKGNLSTNISLFKITVIFGGLIIVRYTVITVFDKMGEREREIEKEKKVYEM